MVLKRLSWGNDSTVYLSAEGQQVIKVYDLLEEKIGKEKSLQTLQRYYDDTLRAAEILSNNNNPLIRVFRLELPYNLNINIVPQGEIQHIPIPETDVPPRISLSDKSCIASRGQQYIPGLHVTDIMDGYNHNSIDNEFHRSINMFHSSMKGTANRIEEILSKSLNVRFSIDYANVKPTLDETTHTIILNITDLAANITTTYR